MEERFFKVLFCLLFQLIKAAHTDISIKLHHGGKADVGKEICSLNFTEIQVCFVEFIYK